MKSMMLFVAASVCIVAVGASVAFPFLAEGARRAVLGAGVLALGTQIPAHLLLRSWRSRNDRFLAAIALGFAGRVAVLAVAIFAFVLPGRVSPAPFLVALGVFLVAILFVESYLESRRVRSGVVTARP